MKKLVIVLLALALLVPVVAAQGVTAMVSPARQVARVGEQFDVAVTLESGNVPVGSYTMELLYDPQRIELVSVSGVPEGFVGIVNGTRPGRIRFNGANIDGAEGQTVLLTATFEARRRGWARLDLNVETMAEASTFTSLLPVQGCGGMVTIRPQFFWWRR